MNCLSSLKMNMRATIIKPQSAPENSGTGHWTYVQDPESGAIERKWITDDPDTPEYEGDAALKAVPCIVRGILNAGLRGAANQEVFDKIYQNINWVKMQFPPGYNITQRDRVTNIRDLGGNVIWRETTEEGSPPTVFDVIGITPVVGPFGQATEYTALLKRAEVQ